jgi:hypothetical protein
MWQWRLVFGMLIGLSMAWTPPSWAQGVLGSTPVPGDKGTAACREVQLEVQTGVGDKTNPPYKNLVQYLIAAARAAKPALKAGEITGSCYFCILWQFARFSRIADQEKCGPDLCDPLSCDDNNACTEDVCDSKTGCVHTTISCDDDNACTEDVCAPETGCSHIDISCDDNNACCD